LKISLKGSVRELARAVELIAGTFDILESSEPEPVADGSGRVQLELDALVRYLPLDPDHKRQAV
jgi:hypothetical protein